MKKSYNIILAGLLTVIGLVLPFVTSHGFGIAGTVLLPMHIPVFLIGLLCGPLFGVLGGLITPVISSLLTGMPAIFPMLPIMIGELMTYGLVGGLMHCKVKMPIYPSLIIAMFCGRITYGLIYAVLLTSNGGAIRAASAVTAIVTGLPGIVIQAVLIPIIVTAVKRSSVPSVDFSARDILKRENASCVVMRDREVVYKANGRGVKPILNLIETQPELLKGSEVIDKIIGKAAALLLVLGGAKRVYGEVMSISAYEYLKSRGIRAEYGRCIDVISNRDGNGICPLEKAVMGIDDPETAYTVLKETVKQLMGA